MSSNFQRRLPTILMFILMAAAAISGWVFFSAQESAAFNRITGASTTTWDAMWVELRVQESPKPPSQPPPGQ